MPVSVSMGGASHVRERKDNLMIEIIGTLTGIMGDFRGFAIK